MNIDISKVSILEKDIEEYIYRNPQSVNWGAAGSDAHVSRWIGRQFEVPSGIIDLIGEIDGVGIAVVEVKLDVIDAKAVAQVCRYAFDIEFVMEDYRDYLMSVPVMRFVVGKSIDTKTMFECIAMNVTPITYSINMSMNFSKIGWSEDYRKYLSERYKSLHENEKLKNVRNSWKEMIDRATSSEDDDDFIDDALTPEMPPF